MLSSSLGSIAKAGEQSIPELAIESARSAGNVPHYDASRPLMVGSRLELSSIDGFNFRLRIAEISLSQHGNRIIKASTDRGGEATIVVEKSGALIGSISEFGSRYRISTGPNGPHQIHVSDYLIYERRVDAGGTPPRLEAPFNETLHGLDEVDRSTPAKIRKRLQSANVIYPSYGIGPARVAILVYYDDSMQNALSVLDFIKQVADDAFSGSAAHVELTIVGTRALDIDDEASHYDLKTAMGEGTPPFTDIVSDRSSYGADIVLLLRHTASPSGDDPCGIASLSVYQQNHYRDFYTGLVQWDPADGESYYCPDETFAHEIGHLLGANHNREDLTAEGDLKVGAYTYSYGQTEPGVFRTVMGINVPAFAPRLALFSSPGLSCQGYPCGVSSGQEGAADNVSTFNSSAHLVASYEGPFMFEAVQAYARRGQESACTTSEGESGYFTGVGIQNQSAQPVDLASLHFRNPEGAYTVFDFDVGERVVASGTSRTQGYCTAEGEAPILGTDYTEAFLRYRHPDSSQLVETEVYEFDLDYAGEYRTVRVAAGEGGTVSGNPMRSERIGVTTSFFFVPDSGHVIESIRSTCSGVRSGANYSVDIGQDNCFVEAFFSQSDGCSAEANLDNLGAEEQVQLVYVGLLARAADAPGLNYWLDDIENGFSIENLRENIVCCQPEYLESLGAMDRPELVISLYQNLFSRTPDDDGKEYWVNGGGSSVSPDRLVLALMNGAGCTDRQVLLNKAEAASYYTSSYVSYSKTDAMGAVRNVDSTAESLQAAKDFVDALGG